MGLNITVEVRCPNCGRKHPRTIRNGILYDESSGSYKEEIIVPKSACHKEPLHKRMKKNARDGEKIESYDDLVGRAYLDQLWLDFHGGGEER